MNHEPRYIRCARGFMSLFEPETLDGMVLGLAIAGAILIGVIYVMGW